MFKIKPAKFIIFALFMFFISCKHACAEDMTNFDVKSKINPGSVDSYLQGQQNSAKQNDYTKKQEAEIKNNLENEPANKINDNKQAVRFELKGVEFSGNTIISANKLNKHFKNLINKNVGFNEIINITSEITKEYRSMGYITSRAYIPQQKIQNGIVKINIMEGEIGKISVNKTKWAKSSYIKNNLLKTSGVEEKQAFNINNINSSLSDINSKDYLKGGITLERGETPASTDILFDIKDKIPLNFKATWDNLGKDYVGIQKAGLNLSNQNVTGFGDTLNSNITFAKGIFNNNVSYSLPLGSKGTELNLGYYHSKIKIGNELKSLGIKGISNDFKVAISTPIYKNKNVKISSSVAYDMLSSQLESSENAVYNNKYELRAIRTGLNLQEHDSKGKLYSKLEVSTGIPILGAKTEKADASDATSNFVRIESSIMRVHSLPYNSYGIFRLSGQYSPVHLLSPEQTQYGGMYSVRGFREGILYGDIGYNLSIEIRKPVPCLPKELSIPYKGDKAFKIPLKNKVFASVFYDQALARELHQNVAYSYKNFLQSTGIGLSFSLTKYINANMYIGIPLGRQRDDRQNSVKFHFVLSSDII